MSSRPGWCGPWRRCLQPSCGGRHICEVLDPDAADATLGGKLGAEERAAARRTFLELHDNGDGSHTGRFKIGTLHAAMLTKALETFTNPSHRPLRAPAPRPHPVEPVPSCSEPRSAS